MMIMYVLFEVLGTLFGSNAMGEQSCCQNSGWIENHDCAQLFLHVFLGLTLTGPKKLQTNSFGIIGLNKEKTPGRCCQSGSQNLPMMIMMYYWRFWNPGAHARLAILLTKTLVLGLKIYDWHNCSFCMSSWGSPLGWVQKRLAKQTVLPVIDFQKEKTPESMLPIWLLAAMMHYDVLLEVLGTLGNSAMLINPVAARSSGLDWKASTGWTVFACLQWGSPLLDQKSFKTKQFTYRLK